MIARGSSAEVHSREGWGQDQASCYAEVRRGNTLPRLWQPAACVFVGAFLTHFLSLPVDRGGLIGFDSDQFYHLSRARQTLFGEVPIRDFFDPGIFLRVYTSAAFQFLFGHNLLGEMLLCIGLLATSAAFAFVLTARLAGSISFGLLSALFLVATAQKPHNYPKAFVPLSSLLVMWAYAERPSARRLLLVAGATALAFLFRHDYGIYVGFAALIAVAATHWTEGRREVLRRTALYAGTVAGLLLPFFAFVQLNGGVGAYLAGVHSYVQDHSVVVRRAPWNELVVLSQGPAVKVRWAEGVRPEERATLETRYQLVRGAPTDGRNWEYEIADVSETNVRRLLTDRRVEDTHGIDRSTRQVLQTSGFPIRTTRRTPEAWLATLWFLIPVLALAVLVIRRPLRGLDPARQAIGDPRVLSLIALSLAATPVLLRQVSAARVADAAAPAVVLGAWLLQQLIGTWRDPRRLTPPVAALTGQVQESSKRRWTPVGSLLAVARIGLAVTLVTVTWLSLWTTTAFRGQLRQSSILAGPAAVVARAGQVTHSLSTTPPLDLYAPLGSTGDRALVRYVATCTRPHDRLLVLSDAPVYSFYFFSGRGFAAGRPTFEPEQFASAESQQLSLQRLQAQSVPIVLVDSSRRDTIQSTFAPLRDYLSSNYSTAQEAGFTQVRAGTAGLQVLVHRQRPPNAVYEPLGLPCFS